MHYIGSAYIILQFPPISGPEINIFSIFKKGCEEEKPSDVLQSNCQWLVALWVPQALQEPAPKLPIQFTSAKLISKHGEQIGPI